MKEFVKDYVDLCKDSGRFYKKHWKGVVLLNVVVIGAELAWHKYKDNLFKSHMKEILEKEEAQK